MTRRTLIASALAVVLLLPTARLRADDVKTGLKTIVTVAMLKNGKPTDGSPAAGVAVHIYTENGDKPLAEGKTDDKGIFLAAVLAGKYRVEVDPPPGATKLPAAKVPVLDNDIMELNVKFIVPSR
ncbi:MAG TPA: hypothetical protein VMS17_07475 [Gemmataceae bacterium]|nr:hypothetical protein [Gemmataceae bacterium]